MKKAASIDDVPAARAASPSASANAAVRGHGHEHVPDHVPDRDSARGHEHGEASRGHDHTGHDHAGHDHDHAGHSHDFSGTPANKLLAALVLTVLFLFVETGVGFFAKSLALLSDAGHMLTDVGALALALLAQRLAARPRSPTSTFGLRRAEILAALANGVVLWGTSLWIVIESFQRWNHPAEVKGGWVLVVATLGLLINLLAAYILSRGASNVNVRAALAHVLADAAGSVAAMVAGGLVYAFGWTRADAVVSLLLSVLIIWGAWRLIRDSVRVLLEGTPNDLDTVEIEETIRETAGVAAVHDLHVWCISEGFPVLTVHVVLEPAAHGVDVAKRVGERIREHHGITHVTVQPEAAGPSLVPAASLVRTARAT
jgi:cobalt-zinc-cadmium efflux system protein